MIYTLALAAAGTPISKLLPKSSKFWHKIYANKNANKFHRGKFSTGICCFITQNSFDRFVKKSGNVGRSPTNTGRGGQFVLPLDHAKRILSTCKNVEEVAVALGIDPKWWADQKLYLLVIKGEILYDILESSRLPTHTDDGANENFCYGGWTMFDIGKSKGKKIAPELMIPQTNLDLWDVNLIEF